MLRRYDFAVVWCPASILFRFGRSSAPALLESLDVLLGSDSLLTGAATLLDEIRAARGTISDARLLDAVGDVAALRLGIAAPSLAFNSSANIVLFRCNPLEAGAEDVLLVMVAGELRVLAPELVPVTGVRGGQFIAWRGVTRWISEEVDVNLRMCTGPAHPRPGR